MQNPIIRNRRRKRISRFVKYYFYSFLVAFFFSAIAYKIGTYASGPNEPTPKSWQYVFNHHLPDIIVLSLVGGLLITLPLPPSKDEK